MNRYILQAVYRGIYSLIKVYYDSPVLITKPLTLPVYKAEGDVVSAVVFDGITSGTLLLQSGWEVVQSFAARLTGANQAERNDTTAGANTEFLNMLAGIIKRTYDHHNLPFSFSLPVTYRQADKAPVFSGAYDEIYLYKVSFKSFLCSIVLILREKKDYTINAET